MGTCSTVSAHDFANSTLFFSCSLRSWCLVMSLKTWQEVLGLQGHVFKVQHINQSSSMWGSNLSSQKEGNEGLFWCSLQGLFSYKNYLGFHYLPTGISSKDREVSLP